jgi:hypothetical protein
MVFKERHPLDGRLGRSVYHHSTALRELQDNTARQPLRYQQEKKTTPGKLSKLQPPFRVPQELTYSSSR